jgi:hypothetical protein
MKLRHLVALLVFAATLYAHGLLQAQAWHVHMGKGPPSAWVGPGWWRFCSFPLFTFLPRRTATLRFVELGFANSAVWGLAAALATNMLFKRLAPRARPGVARLPPR